MILYYLIFKRDLKLSIKKTILSENIVFSQVIFLIYKVPLFKKNIKVVINKV